jgi:two-component system response regulator HydG
LEKILIIDDDVDICALLKRFLERNGYEVSTSFKGQEGLQQFSTADFDVGSLSSVCSSISRSQHVKLF